MKDEYWYKFVENNTNYTIVKNKSNLLQYAFNKVFLIHTTNEKIIFRVSDPKKEIPLLREDYLFELELLEYLRKEGFSVAYPIKWKNDMYLIEEKTEKGIYFCCLFKYVKGNSVIPLNDKQHYEVGVFLAKMHLSLSKFSSTYSRFEWNEYNSVIRPLEQFENNLGKTLSTELEQMKELKKWVLTVIHKDLEIEKGIIHGDMHNYNIHFNEHGEFAVFDFDFLGKSYLAFDIACFIGTQRIYASFLETGNGKINVHPFIEGYSSIRKLSKE